jgi:hypothetical protein
MMCLSRLHDNLNHCTFIQLPCRRVTFRYRRQQVVDFVTGPEARLITVRVMRVPGNPLIKGTFWLGDVQLAAVSTAENNH